MFLVLTQVYLRLLERRHVRMKKRYSPSLAWMVAVLLVGAIACGAEPEASGDIDAGAVTNSDDPPGAPSTDGASDGTDSDRPGETDGRTGDDGESGVDGDGVDSDGVDDDGAPGFDSGATERYEHGPGAYSFEVFDGFDVREVVNDFDWPDPLPVSVLQVYASPGADADTEIPEFEVRVYPLAEGQSVDQIHVYKVPERIVEVLGIGADYRVGGVLR
jgi:hypothetical protein